MQLINLVCSFCYEGIIQFFQGCENKIDCEVL
jgi:hypothetical protein